MKKPRYFSICTTLATALSALLFASLATTSAHAQTKTWNGSSSESWNIAANWDEGAFENGDHVVFPGGEEVENRANFLSQGRSIQSMTFTADAESYNIGTSNNNTGGASNGDLIIRNGATIVVEAGSTADHNIGINAGGANVGIIRVMAAMEVQHNGEGLLSFTRPLVDPGNLPDLPRTITKSGTGTLRITANNNYSGPTIIDAGTLQVDTAGSSVNSHVIVNGDTTFSVQVTDNSQSWTCPELTFAEAGTTLEFDFGSVKPSTTVSPLAVTTNDTSGEVAFTATPEVNVMVESGIAPGTYPLMTWDSATGDIPTEVTVSQLLPETDASLSVDGNTLNLMIGSTAETVVKADNSDDLNLGSSWVGGVAPSFGEIAAWDSTITSPNSTVLGADMSFGGISIVNPAGPVTIGAGNTLTLSTALYEIDMTFATADLTLNCDLALGGPGSWNIASDRTLAMGGTVSGDFPLNMQGGGNVRLDAIDVLANVDETVNVDTNLDLNGNSQTLNSLSGSGVIDNTATGTASTLAIGGNDADSTFDGILQNSGDSATINLVKTGSGTLTLGEANTLSGSVAIEGGNLGLGNVTPLDNVSGITMNPGTQLRPTVADAMIDTPITITGDVSITTPAVGGPGDGGTVNTVNLNSPISGIGNVTLLGFRGFNTYGTIYLGAASNYEGDTVLDTTGANVNIFVNLGIDNALPTSTVLTLDGGDGAGTGRDNQLNLNGFNQTVAGLQNVPRNLRRQRIWNHNADFISTLTVNSTEDLAYSGLLSDGDGVLSFTKSGPGSLTLASSNTYTGETIISGGTLALGASDVIDEASFITLGNATLAIGSGFSDTLNAMEINGDATINIGSGASLEFVFSAFEPWNGSLTITGNFESGSSLRFGNNAGGLSANQLALISGPGLSDIALDGDGFLTATVEIANYTAWANANVGGQSPDQDFDGDGVANGIEYFLNAPAGFTALPTLDATNTITWTNGGNIPASEYGTQFVVQTSGNLVDWTDVPAGELDANADGPDGALSYTLSGLAPRFIRLSVTPTL